MKVNIKKKFSVILTTLLIMACSEQADIEILKLSVGEEKTISDVVAVNGGTIRGIAREGGLHEYLGIPYAAAPVGERRWQSPAKLVPWEGERDSTDFGLPCYQPNSVSAFYDRSYEEMSEDCLTLNV